MRVTVLLVALVLVVPAAGGAERLPRKNGSRIAFIRDQTLFLMKTDGSAPRRVLRREGAAYDPAWSPDGRRLAVVLGDAIWLVNPDGTHLAQLTGAPAHAPAWSPDGGRIAYEVGRSRVRGADVWMMNADGSGKELLARGSSPTWSPDGSRIAFDRTGEAIYVMRADGTGIKRLTPRRRGCNGSPAWSPEGARIAFVGNPTCRTYGQDIWVMRADGAQPRRLTNLGGSFNPAWSPDGRKLLFDSNRHASGRTDIFVVSAEGAKLRRLTRSAAYDASPDWQPAPGGS